MVLAQRKRVFDRAYIKALLRTYRHLLRIDVVDIVGAIEGFLAPTRIKGDRPARQIRCQKQTIQIIFNLSVVCAC